MKTDCPGRLEELSVLLDGELDAEEELELRRHLDGCSTCEALHKDLEALSAALATTIGVTPAPRELTYRVMARTPRRSRTAIQVSSAIAIVATVLIWGWQGDESFDELMVSDHQRLIASPRSLDVQSPDAKLVAKGLTERLPFQIELASAPDARLQGGHACQIRGMDAAYLQYEQHGELISVFAYPEGRPGDSAEPRCRNLGDERLCSWEREGQTVTVVGSRAASLFPPAEIHLVAF